ncbi:hypothetical protein EYF80_044450 [Liparis tanakae]|uniref:Uncharacterized protein n=1 Tax=Liparis tanakae TaxID=230148 RepID=A0A4Z2FVU2_9TELE|nr:hypothetical protein EYF80_044450 [Liparis tanakae]
MTQGLFVSESPTELRAPSAGGTKRMRRCARRAVRSNAAAPAHNGTFSTGAQQLENTGERRRNRLQDFN